MVVITHASWATVDETRAESPRWGTMTAGWAGAWRSPEAELGGSTNEVSRGDYDVRGLRVARDR